MPNTAKTTAKINTASVIVIAVCLSYLIGQFRNADKPMLQARFTDPDALFRPHLICQLMQSGVRITLPKRNDLPQLRIQRRHIRIRFQDADVRKLTR